MPEFTDEQIQEAELESFENRVWDDGILADWFRGLRSDAGLLERLAYLKGKAEANAVEQMERGVKNDCLDDLRRA